MVEPYMNISAHQEHLKSSIQTFTGISTRIAGINIFGIHVQHDDNVILRCIRLGGGDTRKYSYL